MMKFRLVVFGLGILATSSILAQSVSTLRYMGEQALASGNYASAYKYLLAASKQGDAEAQYDLSTMYSEGKGTPTNQAAEIEWLKKSAEQGFAEAELDLGNHYELGDGVPQNHSVGMAWTTKSAEQGNVEAEYLLGLTYMHGSGGLYPTDYKKGFAWLSKAAAQGDGDAQFEIGKAYKNGTGVARDSGKAVDIFKGIAENGGRSGAGALLQLDEIYTWNNDDKTVHQSDVEKYKWLELYYVVGLSMARPEGSSPWPGELDPSRGMNYLEDDMTRDQINEAQQAATTWWNSYGGKYGNAKAIKRKAHPGPLLYADGSINYERGDFRAAYEDWSIGAKSGDQNSQYYLGTYFEDGKGAPRNYLLAFSWYIKAAEQGDPWALEKVGDYYAAGRGVTQDYVEAYKWLQLAYKAAKRDNTAYIVTSSEEELNQIERKMTPEQIEIVRGTASSTTTALAPSTANLRILRLVLAANGTLTKQMHDKFWASFKGQPQSQVTSAVKALTESLQMFQEYQMEVWKCVQTSYETRHVYKSQRLLTFQRVLPARLAKATTWNPNDQEYKDFMVGFQTGYKQSLSDTDRLLSAAATHQPIVMPDGSTVEVNEALIQQVLSGIKGSIGRLQELLNPTWNGT